jgi:hypothetical protein
MPYKCYRDIIQIETDFMVKMLGKLECQFVICADPVMYSVSKLDGSEAFAIHCLRYDYDSQLTTNYEAGAAPKGIALEKIGKHEESKARTSTCNPQESIPLFSILLTGPIFASGKVPIPKTMESIIDNCQLSKKHHRLERNCGPQSRAQHRDLTRSKGYL